MEKILFPLIIGAASVVATWFITRFLDKPRVKIEILRVTLQETQEVQLALADLMALSEFFKEAAGYLPDFFESAAGLEELGVKLSDPGEVAPEMRARAIAVMTRTREQMKKTIAVPYEDARASVTAAQSGLTKIRNAKSEMRAFLIANSTPDEHKKSEYVRHFLEIDNDKDLTSYVPARLHDKAPANDWHRLLEASLRQLTVASEVNERAIKDIEEQLTAQKANIDRGGVLSVQVVVMNNGKTSAGLYEVGLLEVVGSGGDYLSLQTNKSFQELVAKPREHIVITLEVRTQDPHNTQVWPNAVARFKSSTMRCRVKLKTLDGRTVASSAFPFYARDAFAERLIQELQS